MADAAPQDAGASPSAGSPLTAHLQANEEIEWTGWGPIPLVSTFGEPQAEYAAIRKATGLIARPERGVIEVTGKDRLSFLNNLLTNGLVHAPTKTPLPGGHGCYSFLLNLKGRVVADLVVLQPPESETTYLEVDQRLAAILVDTLDRYRFAEKVKFREASDEWDVLGLHGPGAMEVLADAADTAVAFEPTPEPFPATVDLPTATLKLGGQPVIAWRDDVCGVPGVGLLVPRPAVVATWEDLTTRFGQTLDDRQYGQRRLRPVGWGMFNACRIEAGRPMLGIDFAPAPPSRPGPKKDEAEEPKGGTLPAETGPLFGRAVSVTSGCYLGQEVVARMHARQVVARQVVGIRMDEDALPTAGVPVEVEGNAVGTVTSSTLSPVLSGACLCLATIKRPHFEVGTQVTIPAEGRNASGLVVALPFLEG